MNASEIMTKQVLTVTPETDIMDAAKILLEKKINGLLVINENDDLVGIICQSDLVSIQKKLSAPGIFTMFDSWVALTSSKIEADIKRVTASKVKDIMTKNPTSVSPETNLEDIASIMINKNFHTLPVLDNGKIVGIIGKEDILRTLS